MHRVGWVLQSALHTALSIPCLGSIDRRILSEPQVRLDGFVTREKLFCLFALNAWVNDDLVALLPVDWGRNPVLVADLQGINDPQDLIEMTTSACRVRDLEADHLLRVDDKNVTNGERDSLRIDVCGVQGVKHVVLGRDFAIFVADNGEVDRGFANLVDVFDPSIVRGNVVGGKTNDFYASLLEFGCFARHFAKFGGANGGEVIRVREKDAP